MVSDPPHTPMPSDTTTDRKSVPELCQEWTSRTNLKLRNRKPNGRAVTASDLKKLESQLASTKITDDGPDHRNAAKGAPAPESNSITFAISGVIILEEEVDEFEESIDFAKEVLNLVKLADLEDLNAARKCLDDLAETNQALSLYRRTHINLGRLHAVSFSRLTQNHLADMGVENNSLTYPNFSNKIDEWFNKKSFVFGSEGNLQPLSDIFKKFWQGLTEARARLLTDYIMVQVVDFLENYLHLIHLVFLELLLAAAKKNPIVIEHENSATLLTGTVDYAIWSSAITSKAIVQKLGGGNASDLENKIRNLTSESSLTGIVQRSIWNDLKDLNCFKFSIIEEKRKDLKKKKLKDCKPQVIGEGMAITQQTGQGAVPWCLSNGEEWLFGVLDGNGHWLNRSLPVLTILDDNKLEESIQAVFKMLVMWAVIPDDVLLRLLSV